jgi:arylsulfatase A-like enzyme
LIPKLNRREFIKLAGGALAGLYLPGVNDARFNQEILVKRVNRGGAVSPNVLFIVLDTLRADHLGTYGYHRPTPNLDQIAKEGVIFEQAFSTASWTVPSHATLMTGLYSHDHRADVLTGERLGDNFYTLAEAFSDNGYLTVLVSGNHYQVNGVRGFHQGFQSYYDLFWNLENSLQLTRLGQRAFRVMAHRALFGYHQFGRATADNVNQIFFNWLDHHSQRPFFAFLNYFDPHDPYYAPPLYDMKYGDTPALGQPGSFSSNASEFSGSISDEELMWQMDHYDDSIYYLDTKLGELFSFLKRKGLYDNTILVITSDHGESFGEHSLYGHANSLYIELLHVPLLIRYPPAITAGSQVSNIVSLIDLPYTIIDLSKIEPIQPIPGQRIDRVSAEGPAVAELFHNPYHPDTHPVHYGTLTSFTTDKWHAIFTNHSDAKFYREEIYSRNDSRQSNDLSQTQDGRRALAAFRSVLEKIPDPIDEKKAHS